MWSSPDGMPLAAASLKGIERELQILQAAFLVDDAECGNLTGKAQGPDDVRKDPP